MPLHEDLVGCVDHHLPHVVVREEGRQRAVAGEVAERPVGDGVGIDQQVRSMAAPVVVLPPLDLLGDHPPDGPLAVGFVDTDGVDAGPGPAPRAR